MPSSRWGPEASSKAIPQMQSYNGRGQGMWHPCLLGLCQSFPISEKMLIQSCFSFLFMLSIKIECYPLVFDATAFQFRLLMHFMNLVQVPSTAFLPMDRQAHGSQESAPMSISKESTSRLEEPWRCDISTIPLRSFFLLVISTKLYTPWLLKEDDMWQNSIVTCWDSFANCSVWFQLYVNLLCLFVYKIDILFSKVWNRWAWLLFWLSKGLSFIYCLKI